MRRPRFSVKIDRYLRERADTQAKGCIRLSVAAEIAVGAEICRRSAGAGSIETIRQYSADLAASITGRPRSAFRRQGSTLSRDQPGVDPPGRARRSSILSHRRNWSIGWLGQLVSSAGDRQLAKRFSKSRSHHLLKMKAISPWFSFAAAHQCGKSNLL